MQQSFWHHYGLKVLNSDIFDVTVTSKTSENPFISIAFTKGRPLVKSLKILAIFAYYAKKLYLENNLIHFKL